MRPTASGSDVGIRRFLLRMGDECSIRPEQDTSHDCPRPHTEGHLRPGARAKRYRCPRADAQHDRGDGFRRRAAEVVESGSSAGPNVRVRAAPCGVRGLVQIAGPRGDLRGTEPRRDRKDPETGGSRASWVAVCVTAPAPLGSPSPHLVPSHHDHAIGEPIGIRLDMDHLVAFPRNSV